MKNATLSFLVSIMLSYQAVAQTAPGGVSSNLNYWLKADNGVTSDNGRVSQWANQTSTAGNINQAIITRRPSLKTNALNFNPAISFNVSDSDFDFLSTDELVWDSDTVILVFNPNQDSGNIDRLQVTTFLTINLVMLE